METNLVYLGLGSNLGNRKLNLDTALEELSNIGKIIRKSSIYESEPVDYKNQPKFLNLVLKFETQLSPFELIIKLHEIEHRMGRVREIDKGPRCIDIDILFYNNAIINHPNLQIPHSNFATRNFVLTPMLDLNPDHIDPLSLKTIKELIQELKNPEKIRLWI